MPRRSKSGPQIKAVRLAGGRVRWRFVVDVGKRPDGRRDQRTHTYDTLQGARGALARIRADLSRGVFVTPTTLTLGETVEAWLAGRRTIRPGTLANYRNAVKPVVERLGHLPVQALSKAHVDGLVDWMLTAGRRVGAGKGGPLAPATVTLALTVLGMVLEDAVRQGLVVRNAARLVDRPAARQPEMATWTAEQAGQFLAAVADDRWHAAWILSLYGLRRGEVCGLRWEDVDLDEGTIAVQVTRVLVAGRHTPVHGAPKSDRGRRTLPLDESTVKALRALRAGQAAERLAAGSAYAPRCADCTPAEAAGPGGRHVLVDELGDPVHPESYSDRFEVLVRRAALPKIRLHDCRHTTATLMHLRGVPVAVISAWLGHAKASFTLATYAHSQPEALRAAGGVLAGAYTARIETSG
jgi:integrase